jgi:hypothetical protein
MKELIIGIVIGLIIQGIRIYLDCRRWKKERWPNE